MRAELERETLVLGIVVTARVEDEGYGLKLLVLLPFAAEREAVHARQDDIGDDGVRRFAPGSIERFQTVARFDDAMAVRRQQFFERRLLRLALVCNQNHTHAELLPGRDRAAPAPDPTPDTGTEVCPVST